MTRPKTWINGSERQRQKITGHGNPASSKRISIPLPLEYSNQGQYPLILSKPCPRHMLHHVNKPLPKEIRTQWKSMQEEEELLLHASTAGNPVTSQDSVYLRELLELIVMGAWSRWFVRVHPGIRIRSCRWDLLIIMFLRRVQIQSLLCTYKCLRYILCYRIYG